ncbi:MAG: hypothetical protein HZC38_00025 [Chloroflexi bacterium]|nr:hypothetical protein [Chloroflexota bacterium]
MSNTPQLVACPKCGQADRTQKASSIFLGERSIVARTLAPLPEPRYVDPVLRFQSSFTANALSLVVLVVVVYLVWLLASSGRLGLQEPEWDGQKLEWVKPNSEAVFPNPSIGLYFFRCTRGYNLRPFPWYEEEYKEYKRCYLRANIIGGYVLALAYISLSFLFILLVHVAFSPEKRKRKLRVAQEQRRWLEMITKWKNLYYCFRDDGAFDPAENVFIPRERVREFLGQETTQPKVSLKTVQAMHRAAQRGQLQCPMCGSQGCFEVIVSYDEFTGVQKSIMGMRREFYAVIGILSAALAAGIMYYNGDFLIASVLLAQWVILVITMESSNKAIGAECANCGCRWDYRSLIR